MTGFFEVETMDRVKMLINIKHIIKVSDNVVYMDGEKLHTTQTYNQLTNLICKFSA